MILCKTPPPPHSVQFGWNEDFHDWCMEFQDVWKAIQFDGDGFRPAIQRALEKPSPTSGLPDYHYLLMPDEEGFLKLWRKWSDDAKYKREFGHLSRKTSQWEALQIFKEDLFSVAYDHIYSKDNVERWEEVLQLLRRKDDVEMKQKIDRARAFPIEELVRKFGYEPRMGFICCPLHGEKTPSLKIYVHNNTWHCFGCHTGYSTIDFVMKHQSLDFKEAVNFLN